MKELNQLCKEFEQIDALSYVAILTEKSTSVLPALCALTVDGYDGATIFASYIFAAIAADGRITEEEYALSYPLISAFFGDKITYEDCKAAAKNEKYARGDAKKTEKAMLLLFGMLPEDIRDDLIVITLMISAVDGKVSLREKNWIKKLAVQ